MRRDCINHETAAWDPPPAARIDLNQWYACCDDVDRPDYLHYFDLDPVPGAGFAKVLDAALTVHEAPEGFGMSPLVKTTGSKGGARARARRLQPECLGPHARVARLPAPEAARDRVDAGHVG